MKSGTVVTLMNFCSSDIARFVLFALRKLALPSGIIELYFT